MLQTIEAIVEKDGTVRLLEPIHPEQTMRALLTLVEPAETLAEDINDAQSLLTLAGMFESEDSNTSTQVNSLVTDLILKKHAPNSSS